MFNRSILRHTLLNDLEERGKLSLEHKSYNDVLFLKCVGYKT